MRITKKMLKGAKHGIHRRVQELCVLLRTGRIKDELRRCMPVYQQTPSDQMPEDGECLRVLLFDLVELSIPNHWVD